MFRRKSEVSPMARQGELVERIGKLLVQYPPRPWSALRLEARMLTTYAEAVVFSTRPDGSQQRQNAARKVVRQLAELRHLMYAEGTGTWLGMTLTVTEDLRTNASFDYDGVLNWTFPPKADAYALDLQSYPRRPEAIPHWLQLLLP